MEKIKGYKIVNMTFINGEIYYDIAIFGEKSLICEYFQVCERFLTNVSYEQRQKIGEKYGKALAPNFVNDTLIMF